MWKWSLFSTVFSIPAEVQWRSISAAPCSRPQERDGQLQLIKPLTNNKTANQHMTIINPKQSKQQKNTESHSASIEIYPPSKQCSYFGHEIALMKFKLGIAES